jgi:hypothetical protein
MEDDSHFVFRQKLLGEDGSVMVKQSGLFSPNFGATSSHVFTQSAQNVAVEPGIHSLACRDKFFVLPQLLYRWRHQSGNILDTTSYQTNVTFVYRLRPSANRLLQSVRSSLDVHVTVRNVLKEST